MKTDTAQRIAKALARTTEPRSPAEGFTNDEGNEIVGTVPTHLRHLHNLVEELSDEVAAAEAELLKRQQRMKHVHALFFDSLKAHVSKSKEANAMSILKNWDVTAFVHTPDDNGHGMMGGFGLDLDTLMAAMMDPRRR